MARRWHNAVLTVTALLPFAGAPAFAGPNGANVVGGAATVQGQGSANVTVNQTSQNAIINWQTFNIGSGETTKILMPNSNSTQLDRVTGRQGPSQILGTLSSNGKVFLVNPDGILFGMGARINVGSLLATTSDIANKDFMAGNYKFAIPGNPNASIVNMGRITAQTGGFAALVAPGVRNTGTITAKLGTISLASGNVFTLDMYGDNLITLGITDSISSQVIDVSTGQPLKSLISNEGKLKANGGRVTLTAAAARAVVDSVINNTGVIEANSIGSHNGMIVLGAATTGSKPAGAPTQTVKLSGKLSAKGKRSGTKGGTIIVTGENIAVSGATINASGSAGGGKVLIGGDRGGGHPNTGLVSGNASAAVESYSVANSSTVSIDAATMIDASATATGNGGKVIIWANQATTFVGTILAKGGALSGNGGFVETSGGTLSFNGNVNTSALNGKTGTWLLDPQDITINNTNAATIERNLATTNVTLQTSSDGDGAGDITVASALSWTSGYTLTLSAHNNIAINSSISAANGGLTLNAGSAISDGAPVTVGTFTLQNGNWSQIGSLRTFSANNFVINGGSFLRASGGDGSTGSPYQIVDVYGLQGIGSSSALLSSNFVLDNSIDASNTANWNGGAGFIPIGNLDNQFYGSLNGQGFSINNLTINSSAAYVGLFGMIGQGGSVQNLGITNVNLTASGWNGSDDYAHVGALAGFNQGTISNSYATGNIVSFSPADTAPDTGGLVGTNTGSISQSYASVNITESSTGGGLYVGGLVGWNAGGSVSQSYATGTVTNMSDEFAQVGGLIGQNDGTVDQSYSIGAVNGLGNIGGLIGSNSGTVTSSYWNTQTSGQSESDGGAPLTTAQFQSGLPGGFDATAWASGSNLANGYPYLLWQLPNNAFTVVGHIYDGGGAIAGGGINVYGLDSGTSIGTVTTGANGSYNFIVVPGNNVSTQLLLYATGNNAGAAYAQNVGGPISLNIYEGYLTETGGATTLSALSAGLVTAIGGNTSAQALVNGLSNRSINANGASFNIDQSLSAGTLLLSSSGPVTQSAPLNVTNLALLGGSASFTLTNDANQVGTLAANAGSVNFTNATNLTIGNVGGTNGVTASGALTLDVNGNITAPTAPVNVGTFTLANGNWTQLGSLPGFSANNFVISGGSFLRALGGDGSASSPYQITDAYGLQGIGSNATMLSRSYILANAIDASGTAGWNGGAGFVPLGGNNATSFTGTLNGNGNTISGLTINASSINVAGLFGFVGTGGTVENVGLTGGSVRGGSIAGELIGLNGGTVTNSYATGTVNGTTSTAADGGLIGTNDGAITGSYASGAVNGGIIAGGLAGINQGTISQSYATGNVTTGDIGIAGGLVGLNLNTSDGAGHVVVASITGSYATGNVSAGNGSLLSTTSTAGGLVGDNYGSVSQSYATGAVTVGANGTAGGLVGQNGLGTNFGQFGTASISNSYATGAVSSSGINVQLGGLVGQNDPGAQITNSQATGNVTSTASLSPGNTNGSCSGSGTCDYVNVGGYVGANFGSISGTTWTTAPTNCAASYACASGAVSVGALGSGGGFAGMNQGIISYAFATGGVIGTAGQANTGTDTFDNTTSLGGFVASNQGQISHS
ncbi:MAG: GLUG motif-containing protein, partial [Xanthobacteraceae bacterium]